MFFLLHVIISLCSFFFMLPYQYVHFSSCYHIIMLILLHFTISLYSFFRFLSFKLSWDPTKETIYPGIIHYFLESTYHEVSLSHFFSYDFSWFLSSIFCFPGNIFTTICHFLGTNCQQNVTLHRTGVVFFVNNSVNIIASATMKLDWNLVCLTP